MTAPATTAPKLTTEDRAVLDDLLLKLKESKKATEAWRAEKADADRRWAARREEIRATEPFDTSWGEKAEQLEADLAKLKTDHKHELRAAAAERDAAIARAKAEYAKKEDTLNRAQRAKKAAIKDARENQEAMGEDHEARVRRRYADERASFYARERELNARERALDREWRDPVNQSVPKHVRDAFWAAYREA